MVKARLQQYGRTNSSFLLDIERGLYPDLSKRNFEAYDNIGTAFQNIWNSDTNMPAQITYLTADTTCYIASTSASDTDDVIIQGMNDAYEDVTVSVTLNGTTPVAIGTDLYRIFSASIPNATAQNVGDIYILKANDFTAGVPDTASDVLLRIPLGRNYGSIFATTVPVGYTLHLDGSLISEDSAKTTTMQYRYRLPGKAWLYGSQIIGTEGVIIIDFKYAPAGLTVGMDFEILAKVDVGTENFAINQIGILIDLSK